MLKRIIACGASTGGKTTFATELVKRYQLQHIQIDPILEAFEDVYPQLGITHDANTHKKHMEVSRKFGPFLSRMIQGLNYDNFVIEGFRIPLRDIVKQYGKTHGIYVFGFPDATPEEKLKICRKCGNNWTVHMTDQQLLPILTFLIEESRFLQKECEKLDVPFFNTGSDYKGRIKRALKMVEKRFG